MDNTGNTVQGNTNMESTEQKAMPVFNKMLNRQRVTAPGVQAGNNDMAHGQARPNRAAEPLMKNGQDNTGNTVQGNTNMESSEQRAMDVFNKALNRGRVTAPAVQAGNNDMMHGQARANRAGEPLLKNEQSKPNGAGQPLLKNGEAMKIANAAMLAKAKKLLTKTKDTIVRGVNEAKAGYKGEKGLSKGTKAESAGRNARKAVTWAQENPGKTIAGGGTAAIGAAALSVDRGEKKAEAIYNKIVQ